MAKEKENSLASELSKIQAIKEIIAGDDIKEIRASITALEEKMDRRLDELTQNLTEAIRKLDDKVSAQMEKKSEKDSKTHEKLDDSKVDRHKLGKLLQKLGETLQA